MDSSSSDEIDNETQIGDAVESKDASSTGSRSVEDCKFFERLLGDKEWFDEIITEDDDLKAVLDQQLSMTVIKKALKDVQIELFKSPTFVEEQMKERKEEIQKKELELKKEVERLEDLQKQEDAGKTNTYNFDFGHLDAKVNRLIKQLENVYLDVTPKPDSANTSSMYTIAKKNIEKLGLKIILNRLCILGTYSEIDQNIDQGSLNSKDNGMTSRSNLNTWDFASELKTIRQRTNSLFEKELGQLSGCLLSYPCCFFLFLEGPELSILDLLQQAEESLNKRVSKSCVLFIAPHVLVRYMEDWTDLIVKTPPKPKKYTFGADVEDEEAEKEGLLVLSRKLEKLWAVVGKARRKGVEVSGATIDMNLLPDEGLFHFAMISKHLRPLKTWIDHTLHINDGSFIPETWPQGWYLVPLVSYAPDEQMDSLGTTESRDENIPGLNEQLEEFIKTKPSWKPVVFD